ncbi:MAG TPA: hypothetical protein VGF24_20810 [Vicinamibacterales bacterium]|jgi:hypothetical protein
MRAFVLSLLVVCACSLPIGAQKPTTPPPTPVPDASTRLKSSEYKVVVNGCISGRRLSRAQSERPDTVFTSLGATEFVLQAPRELLKQITERHDGHYDQIEGVVTVPAAINGGSSTVSTKEFGKTRVTLGGTEEGKAYIQNPPKSLTLKVASLTHLKEGCAAN